MCHQRGKILRRGSQGGPSGIGKRQQAGAQRSGSTEARSGRRFTAMPAVMDSGGAREVGNEAVLERQS